MPAMKNVDVAWDSFASVRHDENALDIAEAYGLAAADVSSTTSRGSKRRSHGIPKSGACTTPNAMRSAACTPRRAGGPWFTTTTRPRA
jgi:hypothetical protein